VPLWCLRVIAISQARRLSARLLPRRAAPRSESVAAARVAPAALTPVGPLLASAAVMLAGILMRIPSFGYRGEPTWDSYSYYAVRASLGAYSGIAKLYFRDHMWLHHLPYLRYPLEYPVGTGLFAWLAALPGGGITAYLAISACGLAVCGLVVIGALGRLPGARPWVLALAPGLALYVVQNWDLLSLAALAVALVLFHRRRDGWGAVVLALATWTKLFPILALPVVLLARTLEAPTAPARLRKAASILIPFTLASIAINGPFALREDAHGGLTIIRGWLYFFTFNTHRPLQPTNVWTLLFPHGLPLAEINRLVALTTVAGIALALATLAWASRRGTRPQTLILPATLACLSWFLLANKVYSPEYGIWAIALLAAAGAPLALAGAFAAADLAFFLSVFTMLAQQGSERSWLMHQAVVPANALLEGLLLASFAWALTAMLRPARWRPRLPRS